jgi:hypothetical protein
MASGSGTRREELFSLYAKNLSIYFPGVSDVFLCPVCRVPFDRGALTSRPPKVALAHIVPRALGGRLCTLVCGACDNKAGSAFDSHAGREKRLCDWQQGRVPISGHLKHESGRMGVEVDLPPGGTGWRFHIKKGRSDPASVARFFDRATSAWSETKFTLSVTWYDPARRDTSLLYAAFLRMFYEFGYEYALDLTAHVVRHAIVRGTQASDFHNAMFPLRKPLFDTVTSEPLAGILVEPRQFRSFIVVLPSPRQDEAQRCVLMPGFGEGGLAAHQRILNLPEPFGDFTARFASEDPRPRLANPELRGFGHWLWTNLK